MEFVGYLAPIAFIFALGAYAQCNALRRELKELRKEVEELKAR
jgi:hypothetical protein